jgi:Holliday junction resolvasome RuvABC DNA-binding subunit
MANRTRSNKRSNQRKSNKRNKRSYKKSKKQIGGADFNQEQTQQLLDMGFTEANIQTLAQVFLDNMSGNAAMNLIQQSLGQINNITGQPNTPQEIMDSLNPDNNENNISGIGSENASENDISVGSFAFENENDLSDIGDENNSQHNISDDSFVFDQDDLDNNLNNNIDDISEDSIVSNQGDTTGEDSSLMDIDELNLGGRRRKTRKGRKGRKSRKQRGGTEFSEEQLTELGRLGFNDNQKKFLAQEFGITPPDVAMNAIRQAVQRNHPTGRPDTVEGGKRRRKTRKMRGGMRYGTGVGANCFDPNFSIYNTPTLSLFPYKPN